MVEESSVIFSFTYFSYRIRTVDAIKFSPTFWKSQPTHNQSGFFNGMGEGEMSIMDTKNLKQKPYIHKL